MILVSRWVDSFFLNRILPSKQHNNKIMPKKEINKVNRTGTVYKFSFVPKIKFHPGYPTLVNMS